MMQLTTEQKREIERHRVPLSKVFDASGLSQEQAKKAMSEDKEIVMVNGLMCRNDRNHVLRTRYGHCVECNPAGIAMQARKNAVGHTYLAGSERTGFLKIGMAADPQRREGVLNSQRYGGASDWKLLAVVETSTAGLIEYEAQRTLSAHQVDATYLKDGRNQACYEIFRCPHEVALGALKKAASVYDGKVIMEAKPDGRYGTSEQVAPQHAVPTAALRQLEPVRFSVTVDTISSTQPSHTDVAQEPQLTPTVRPAGSGMMVIGSAIFVGGILLVAGIVAYFEWMSR